jgi:protein gp37
LWRALKVNSLSSHAPLQHRPVPGRRTGDLLSRVKPGWLRALRDECADLDIAVFMRQVGSDHSRWPADICGKGDDMGKWSKDLRVRQFPFGKVAP